MDPISLAEAAAQVGVHPSTVKKWIREDPALANAVTKVDRATFFSPPALRQLERLQRLRVEQASPGLRAMWEAAKIQKKRIATARTPPSGFSVDQAAVRLGVSSATVRGLLTTYQLKRTRAGRITPETLLKLRPLAAGARRRLRLRMAAGGAVMTLRRRPPTEITLRKFVELLPDLIAEIEKVNENLVSAILGFGESLDEFTSDQRAFLARALRAQGLQGSATTAKDDFFTSLDGFGLAEARDEFTREYIKRALDASQGQTVRAARRLNVSRQILYQMCNRLGISVPQLRGGGMPVRQPERDHASSSASVKS